MHPPFLKPDTVLAVFWDAAPMPYGISAPPCRSWGVFRPNDGSNSSRWLFMWRSSKVTLSRLQWPSDPIHGCPKYPKVKLHCTSLANPPISLGELYCCRCTKPTASSLLTLQPLRHKMPIYLSLWLGGKGYLRLRCNVNTYLTKYLFIGLEKPLTTDQISFITNSADMAPMFFQLTPPNSTPT